MTRKEVEEMMSGTVETYPDFAEHETLVGLTVIYEDDEGDTELTYAVPQFWLQNVTGHQTAKGLRNWLKYTYTSDESKQILEKAILFNKVVFYNFR